MVAPLGRKEGYLPRGSCGPPVSIVARVKKEG